MNSMFYSKSTGGFYTTEIHGDNIPADVVEITAEQHVALTEGQNSGKVITSDENGFPILIDPVITPEQLAAIERVWRDGELDRADIELNKVQDGMGTGTVSVWREYRCLLRNWPENEFFPDSTKRPAAPDAPVVLPVGE